MDMFSVERLPAVVLVGVILLDLLIGLHVAGLVMAFRATLV